MKLKIIPNMPALLLFGRKKSLVISDIHIGFESQMLANDIFIGKNTSSDEIIYDIHTLLDEYKADDVILLGDIKSGIKTITKTEWNEVPKFFTEIQKKAEVTVIPGNHDSNIQRLAPEKTTIASSNGIVIANTLLTHGHAMPSENFAVERIIMGHLHPVFFEQDSLLNGERVWVSIKADKQDIFPSQKGEIEITIVPSFNKYFYATHKNYRKKSISPIIQRLKNIHSAKIATLDGIIIGNEDILSQVI